MKRLINKKFLSIALVVSLLAITVAGCSGDSGGGGGGGGKIVFADAGWDSVKFHNAVAGTIVEELWDYTWEEVPGSSPVTHEGVLTGEIVTYHAVFT